MTAKGLIIVLVTQAEPEDLVAQAAVQPQTVEVPLVRMAPHQVAAAVAETLVVETGVTVDRADLLYMYTPSPTPVLTWQKIIRLLMQHFLPET